MRKVFFVILFAIGLVLFTDQLNLLIPELGIGGFLGDLSWLDPTQEYTDVFHHWMLGLVFMVISIFGILSLKGRKR